MSVVFSPSKSSISKEAPIARVAISLCQLRRENPFELISYANSATSLDKRERWINTMDEVRVFRDILMILKQHGLE